MKQEILNLLARVDTDEDSLSEVRRHSNVVRNPDTCLLLRTISDQQLRILRVVVAPAWSCALPFLWTTLLISRAERRQFVRFERV